MAFEDEVAAIDDRHELDKTEKQIALDKEQTDFKFNEGLEKSQLKDDLRAKKITQLEHDKKNDAITHDYDLKQSEARRKGGRDLIILKRKYQKDRRRMFDKALQEIERNSSFVYTTSPAAESVEGDVVKVVDGDTFYTRDFRVRMVGINSAELGTEQGTLDANKLSLMIANKRVKMMSDASNQYDAFGRLLAVVYLGAVNINVEMLKSCNARLDLRESNKQLDVGAFKNAARVCLGLPETTPSTPSPAPSPEPAPANLTISARSDASSVAVNMIHYFKINRNDVDAASYKAIVDGVPLTDKLPWSRPGGVPEKEINFTWSDAIRRTRNIKFEVFTSTGAVYTSNTVTVTWT